MSTGIADLTGVRAKLRRAKEHFGTLESEIKDWGKQQTYTRKFHIRRDGPWYVVTADPFPIPDIRLCVIAGDVLFNVRSALDHLVWQLVLRDGNEPAENNQFPICDEPEIFSSEIKGRKRLDGIVVDGDAWAIIVGAQPYPGSPFSPNLTVLRRLSNMDKHRTLFAQLPIASAQNIAGAIGWSPNAILLEQRFSGSSLSLEQVTELVRYRFTDQPDPNVHVKAGLPVDPCFGEVVKDGWQVSPAMFNTFINIVSGIVDKVGKLPRVKDI